MKIWNRGSNKIIIKGDDFYLIDQNKEKILDGVAGMWSNVWGYGENPIIKSMQKQLSTLPNSTLFGLGNRKSVNLAEKLIKLCKGMDKVFYSDNGSTAIEIALKMSTQYWRNKNNNSKKHLFLSLRNGYHGDTIGTMSVGFVANFFESYKSILLKTFRVPSPKDYEFKFEVESEIVDKCLDLTEKKLKKYSSKISAMIMESGAQIAGGVSIYPRNYQKKISELCKKYDVLLILDEIATGFGRLGNMIEYEKQKSIPDIVCYGKALNGGYFPIAVTLTTNKIYKAFLGNYKDNKQFFHGHTYTGHPVGCTACITNIDHYKKTNLIVQIQQNSIHVQKKLNKFYDLDIVSKIRHKGLLTGIDLVNGKKSLNFVQGLPINYYIMKESLRRGVYLRTLGNILTIIPPLAIPRAKLDILIDVSYEILYLLDKEISHIT
ncbi:MAG TPA: adenosylmethionine--8-amino-7-oxononanoate transaminase, partial [Nitrososphaeraceae archaeon]|nr:adenosylmethionine--8-amino-7-oxononanoate transaminase [Nitrososphaeraceae archaeon]